MRSKEPLVSQEAIDEVAAKAAVPEYGAPSTTKSTDDLLAIAEQWFEKAIKAGSEGTNGDSSAAGFAAKMMMEMELW